MKTISPILVVLVLLFSCKKKDEIFLSAQVGVPGNTVVESFESLDVQKNFDFRTSENVTLTITDNQKAFYDIYFEDGQNFNLGSFYSFSNRGQIDLVVPTYIREFKLKRNFKGTTESFTVDIMGDLADFSFGNFRSKKSGCSDLLYAVNNDGGFYTIDVGGETYNSSALPNLTGGGSIACAVNKTDRFVYYNTSSGLRYYDIDNGTFHLISSGSNPFGSSATYPRMEYVDDNGLMYIAKNEVLHVMDLSYSTSQAVTSYSIQGLESPVSGGDLAFASDGTLYMCCFSGLYRITFTQGSNAVQATRISAENLPFQPTSMAIDRNDRLYLATNDANSQLIEMDKFDGAWSVVKTYSHRVNDLGSLPCEQSELDQTDTDGDGVIDVDDDFPDDPDEAYEIFTPSDIGWGTYAFEDLYPAYGDFDFNDLVVSYRAVQIANSSNELTRLKLIYKIKAIGASYKNGFGLELPISESLIESVSGYNLTSGATIALNAKGLEAGQTKPVVIVFDNAFDNGPRGACSGSEGDEITINIDFINTVPQVDLNLDQFNYFIFRTENRGHEVHLKSFSPSSLADMSLFGTFNDASSVPSTYYLSNIGLPWGLHIIHNFRQMKEKEDIITGYNFFVNWAQSSGEEYADWYKDNSGFRNTSKICTQ